jgi:type II secretory pathway pseudopilin PulG
MESRTSHNARSNRAFTLVELLVVIGIIVLVIALVLVAITQIQRQSRTAVCLSNQRQLNAGYFMYASDNSGLVMSPQTGSNGAVPDNEYMWVRDGSLIDFQGETMRHLERGAMWTYAGANLGVYRSPLDPFPYPSPAEMNGTVASPNTRMRTYSITEFVGQIEPPLSNWGQRPEYERNQTSDLKAPSRTILTTLEYDYRGHNMGAFAIDLSGSGVWTDKIAPWNPGVWNFSMHDGSTLSHRYAARASEMESRMTQPNLGLLWPGPDYEWLRRHLDPSLF